MKQKFFVFSMGLTVLAAITFSCSNQEDVVPTSDDLSIKSQVPRRKVSGEQYNLNPTRINQNNKDECALIVLVKLTGKHRMFTQNYSADDCMDAYRKEAMNMKDDDGNPRYTGGRMGLDVFEEMGKKKKLFEEKVDLSQEENPSAVFEDKKKSPKVVLIDIQRDGETVP